MENIIAQENFIAERHGEMPFTLTIKIGAPYQDAQHPGEWLCLCIISPLHQNLSARSNSSLQSLYLAIRLVRTLASYFIEDGGTIKDDDGSEVIIDDLFGSPN